MMKASSSAEKDYFIQNKILFSAENGVKIPYQGFQSQRTFQNHRGPGSQMKHKKRTRATSRTRFENEPVISQKTTCNASEKGSMSFNTELGFSTYPMSSD